MEPELAVKTLHRTSNRVHRSCEATVLLSSRDNSAGGPARLPQAGRGGTARPRGWYHRVHRVATAAFWSTFHHVGKISPGLMRVGGARPSPFIKFTITSKVAVYIPAEWHRYTNPVSSLVKICTLVTCT
jgi:hypothetical protein